MDWHSLAQLGRLAAAFVLTYLLGFERDLRGAPAGDRTFALIGVGSAVIATLAREGNAPNALAGVITGVGFIGAGVVFRPSVGQSARRHAADAVRGLTTAGAIFAAAAIGAACGFDRLTLGVGATALVLLALEVRYIPVLKVFDGRHWAPRFTNDEAVGVEEAEGGGGAAAPTARPAGAEREGGGSS